MYASDLILVVLLIFCQAIQDVIAELAAISPSINGAKILSYFSSEFVRQRIIIFMFIALSASLLTDVLTPANHANVQAALIGLLPLATEAHAEIRKFEPLSCALFLGLLRVEVSKCG